MIYAVAIIISIIILVILIIWKSIKKSDGIVCNVRDNIDNQIQFNKIKEHNEQLLSELRIKFLEAQTNGINRISYINKLKKELEKYINRQEKDEDEMFTY